MASLKEKPSFSDYQAFIESVYGQPNILYFNPEDMLINVQRFLMRGVKGIRKKDKIQILGNLLVSMSWFTSFLNRYNVNIEDNLWSRFPYACSYCGMMPCSCKSLKVKKRREIVKDDSKRPDTIKGFQAMFEKIYPSKLRTLEHAGIHLCEELGELAEAFMVFKSSHTKVEFNAITAEAMDLISCYLGVFNSLSTDMSKELSRHYKDNCSVCHNAPCTCTFKYMMSFKL